MAWRGRVKTTSGEKSSDLGRMCHYQPLLIVHYHRLTVIDHLAVGLIDAVTYGSKEPVAAARARARSCSFLRLDSSWLIKRRQSAQFVQIDLSTGAKQNGCERLAVSRICRLSRVSCERGRSSEPMCALRIIITLNAALKLAHVSRENCKAPYEVY